MAPKVKRHKEHYKETLYDREDIVLVVKHQVHYMYILLNLHCLQSIIYSKHLKCIPYQNGGGLQRYHEAFGGSCKLKMAAMRW